MDASRSAIQSNARANAQMGKKVVGDGRGEWSDGGII